MAPRKKSLVDIARELNVSKTTVSFVLNGKGDQHKISEETQKKIINLAKEWNYRPNQLARSLSLGRSNTIGLIVPDISDTFYANICRKIEDCADKHKLTVTIGSSDEDPEKEKDLIEVMRNRQTDGIILASCLVNSEPVLSMKNEHYPFVLFDRFDDEVDASYVLVEGKDSSARLVEELAKKGHKRIAMVMANPNASTVNERFEGYKLGLLNSNLFFDQQLVFEVDFNNIRDGIRTAFDQLFENNSDVTAVLFSNNVLAAEGIWASNIYYKEKIEQLDFACFDDLAMFDYSKPTVISVAQPIDDIASNIVELLVSQLKTAGKKIENLILEPELIVR